MGRHGWRFPPERRHLLKDEERRQWLPPERILAAAHVQPGQTVVDLGAGTGYWVETLATMVGPQGRVFAVDVEPIMLDELRALIQDRQLSNVEVVESTETSVPLESGIADLVLLVFVLHEPADPEAFLEEVVRLLKPNGHVLTIDWEERPTEHGPPLEVRISRQEAHALLGAAGLTVDEIESPSEDFYVLLAQEFRPGNPEMTAPSA